MDGWSKDQRRDLLDRLDGALPLSRQARLLGLNRSSLYYRPVAPSPEELALKNSIDVIYTRWPFYGSRRIAAQLRREGTVANRKAVQRHMQEMGIAGIRPTVNLSRRRHEHEVYPYLLRGLSITAPDQVWGIDLTYIRLQRTWMYLVAIMDWYSRYVVDWELGDTMDDELALAPVSRALTRCRPGILNSDQGSQFTSNDYSTLVINAGVRISMDGRGRALDNVFTERLWRSLKYEEVYLKEYASPRDARAGVAGWLRFYNHERVHQALGYRTPTEVYHGMEAREVGIGSA